MKEKQRNMELDIMCCILLKPKLMEEIEIQDSEFTNYKRIWKFLKAFYQRFKTFDVELMASVCNDKYQIVEYAEMILERDVNTKHFKKYQKRLIELNNQNKLEVFFTDKMYEYIFQLSSNQITSKEFIEKANEIYKKIQILK